MPEIIVLILEPRQKIKVAAHVAGVLKDVPVDRADTIHKGQLLAQLESGVEEAMLELAKAKAESDATVKAREARLAFLSRKRDRTVELQKRDAASFSAMDEAESDFRVATQDVSQAESDLQIAKLDVVRAAEVVKQRSILSPIDGVVAERNLLGGEYAYEQAPIMTIAQIDPLNVEVFVPVSLYGAVKLGMEASIAGEQPVGGRYSATIRSHRSAYRFAQRHIRRLGLPNPENKIPAGLRCKVEFPIREASQ